MTVLDARDIAPEKTRSLFDVPLREFLVLAECAKAVTNNHGCSPRNRCKRVYSLLDIPDMYSCQPQLVGEEKGSLIEGSPLPGVCRGAYPKSTVFPGPIQSLLV